MPVTVTIPLAVLATGVHDFPAAGGQPVADADSQITLNIDRTVSHGGTAGLNGQPVSTVASLQTFQSADGVTWQNLAGADVPGGVYSKGGTQINTAQVVTTLNAGTGRLVRAVVTVTGAAVAVAGTLVTS